MSAGFDTSASATAYRTEMGTTRSGSTGEP